MILKVLIGKWYFESASQMIVFFNKWGKWSETNYDAKLKEW